MTLSIDKLDEEIRAVEARIASERAALERAVIGCTESLRNTATSPKTLVALAGVGFGIGKLMFGHGKAARVSQPANKAGVLGLLAGIAGTAISLIQPRVGLGSIVRWAASRAFAARGPKATSDARARSRATAGVS